MLDAEQEDIMNKKANLNAVQARKTSMLASIMTCMAFATLAWGQSLDWARQFGTTNYDGGRNTHVSQDGSIYVIGETWAGLPDQFHAGGGDVFICRYNSSGSLAWCREFGSTNNDSAADVETDADGYVYMLGTVAAALPGQTQVGSSDYFIRKYDSGGTEIMTRQAGTTAGDMAADIDIDSSGNLFLSGYTGGAFPGQTNAGSADAFVCKCDLSSNEIWIRQFGNAGWNVATGVKADSQGNVYVAGSTDYALPGQTNAGSSDAFIRKYDTHGNVLWTRQFGSTNGDIAMRIALDSGGNVLVSGYTYGALPGQEYAGGQDVFVCKYDEDGNELWTREYGTTDTETTPGIFVDIEGSSYVSGSTGGGFSRAD